MNKPHCIFCGDSRVRLNTATMRYAACTHCPPRRKKRQQEQERVNPHNIVRVRLGKTVRDHKSGSWRQRLTNRAARAALIRETPWNKPLPAVM